MKKLMMLIQLPTIHAFQTHTRQTILHKVLLTLCTTVNHISKKIVTVISMKSWLRNFQTKIQTIKFSIQKQQLKVQKNQDLRIQMIETLVLSKLLKALVLSNCTITRGPLKCCHRRRKTISSLIQEENLSWPISRSKKQRNQFPGLRNYHHLHRTLHRRRTKMRET